jgi:hypothetical protein
MHLKNPGIVKIPTNPDSYRDRGAAAGSGVLKVSPFRRGETIDYSSKILLQFTKTCIFGFQN